MVLLATGSPLVAGSTQPQGEAMQTKQAKVLRPFFYKRSALKVGDVLVLPAPFAIEMEAAKKIEFIDPPSPKEETKTSETTEQTAAKTKKEEKPKK